MWRSTLKTHSLPIASHMQPTPTHSTTRTMSYLPTQLLTRRLKVEASIWNRIVACPFDGWWVRARQGSRTEHRGMGCQVGLLGDTGSFLWEIRRWCRTWKRSQVRGPCLLPFCYTRACFRLSCAIWTSWVSWIAAKEWSRFVQMYKYMINIYQHESCIIVCYTYCKLAAYVTNHYIQ